MSKNCSGSEPLLLVGEADPPPRRPRHAASPSSAPDGRRSALGVLILAHALKGEGADLPDCRGSPLVEIVDAADLVHRQPPPGIAVQPVQERLQLGPVFLLAGDERLEVEDHRICLLFTLRYWATRSALSLSEPEQEL